MNDRPSGVSGAAWTPQTSAQAWQPIETAPKDGTDIDLWVIDRIGGHRETDCRWINHTYHYRGGATMEVSGWGWGAPDHPYFFDDCKATHWMPLPEPPQ